MACSCSISTETSISCQRFGRRAGIRGVHCQGHAPNVSLSKEAGTRKSLKFDSRTRQSQVLSETRQATDGQQHPWLIFREKEYTQRQKEKVFLVPVSSFCALFIRDGSSGLPS